MLKCFLGALLTLAAMTSGLSADKLRVVATFDILADWVQQIAGERVDLIVLVPTGQDIHTFAPTPRQVTAIAKADLIVEIGAGLEYWLEDMVQATGFGGRRVVLSDVIELRETGHDDHHHGEGCQGHHLDPHVWTDPLRVTAMSELIAAALSSADPSQAKRYQADLDVWREQLAELDRYARERFNAVPPAERVIITYHDNLAYFAERYGIRIPATILGSVTTEGGDPSARQMASLIRLIRQENIRAVFNDGNGSPRLARQVCREAGLPPPQTLYVDSFAIDAEGPHDYAALFRTKVDTIAAALPKTQANES